MANRGKREHSVESSRQAKRRQFEVEEKRSGGLPLPLLVAALGVAVLVLGVYLLLAPSGAPAAPGGSVATGDAAGVRRAAGTFAAVQPVDGRVSLPVAELGDRKVRFYTLRANGKDIDFYVLKASDGSIRAAIDSCDVCYAARKGYHQEGDEMVCNNCGQRFSSLKIGEIRGGCNPVGIDVKVQGDTVTIDANELTVEGVKYF